MFPMGLQNVPKQARAGYTVVGAAMLPCFAEPAVERSIGHDIADYGIATQETYLVRDVSIPAPFDPRAHICFYW